MYVSLPYIVKKEFGWHLSLVSGRKTWKPWDFPRVSVGHSEHLGDCTNKMTQMARGTNCVASKLGLAGRHQPGFWGGERGLGDWIQLSGQVCSQSLLYKASPKTLGTPLSWVSLAGTLWVLPHSNAERAMHCQGWQNLCFQNPPRLCPMPVISFGWF